ncbi:MAG: ABC transporter ATP-binding protein [Acidimicrobiia bacterium]|nr:ABC transporter ATP-binding protein [Acidimicrobiia bacterium]
MLSVEDLTVRYGDATALDSVDIEMPAGATLAVMGESGSGKSTLLRAIAGLVKPASGAIYWNGENIVNRPAHQRGFGLMFQDYALFPHLSVAENVSFGLRMTGVSSEEQARATTHHLQLVGLSGYHERHVDELSGGEQQRVALARTLAADPQLVLLDEPLGALDRSRRDQLLADMQQIFTDSGVGAIYVTHDHHEAFAVADQIAVLHEGRLVRSGPPNGVWADPRHATVATLLGFPVARIAVRGGVGELGSATFAINLPDGAHQVALGHGAITINTAGDLDVKVVARRFEGGTTIGIIEAAGQELAAQAPPAVQLGKARASIDPEQFRLLES